MTLIYNERRATSLKDTTLSKEVAENLKSQIDKEGLPNVIVSGPEESGKVEVIYAASRVAFDENFNENTEFIDIDEFFSKTTSKLRKDKRFKRYFSEARREIKRMYSRYGIDKGVGRASKEVAFRQFIKSVSSNKPVAGANYRLMVFFGADKMPRNLQNSMRRVMEKYSNNCRYAFVVDGPGSLIPPLRSRCLLIPLTRPSDEMIEDRLWEAIDARKIDISQEACEAIVFASDGSIFEAFMLLDCLDSINKEGMIEIEDVKKIKEGISNQSFESSLIDALTGEVRNAINTVDSLVFEENVELKDLVRRWHRVISKLQISENKKTELRIKLAEFDADIAKLPRDPNKIRKYCRPLYEKFLSSIAKN